MRILVFNAFRRHLGGVETYLSGLRPALVGLYRLIPMTPRSGLEIGDGLALGQRDDGLLPPGELAHRLAEAALLADAVLGSDALDPDVLTIGSLLVFLPAPVRNALRRPARLALTVVLASACVPPTAPSAPAPARTGEPPAARGGDSAGGAATPRAPAPRPYDRVITSKAQTRRGLFAVHRVDDKLFFEIPRRELNKDMLPVGRYARAAAAGPDLPPGQFGAYGGDQFAGRALR